MAVAKIRTAAVATLILVRAVLSLRGCDDIKSTNRIRAASVASVSDDCGLLNLPIIGLMLFTLTALWVAALGIACFVETWWVVCCTRPYFTP